MYRYAGGSSCVFLYKIFFSGDLKKAEIYVMIYILK